MLCHFMNAEVWDATPINVPFVEKTLRYLTGRSINTSLDEYSVWVTNGIKELALMPEVELHVISPKKYLKSKTEHFIKNGVNYYFFQDEDGTTIEFVKRVLNRQHINTYKKNYRQIHRLLEDIDPDILHLIGAETLYYSGAIVNLKRDYPIITQLQTLLCDPEFKKNYTISNEEYRIRKNTELQVFQASDYLGTVATKFVDYLKKTYPKYKILKTTLALTEAVYRGYDNKEYDCIYYAANINKAADYAIEAFILASKKKPNITMDIIGSYDEDYKLSLQKRLEEFGLKNNVTFEGRLATHEDVLKHIRKCKIAVLPMKIDLITGTVRESMANGIPVVTTTTPASPKLNTNRQSVLLSEKGDFQTMADNMVRLLTDSSFYTEVKENAYKTTEERSSNRVVVENWVNAYKACIEEYKNGVTVPDKLIW